MRFEQRKELWRMQSKNGRQDWRAAGLRVSVYHHLLSIFGLFKNPRLGCGEENYLLIGLSCYWELFSVEGVFRGVCCMLWSLTMKRHEMAAHVTFMPLKRLYSDVLHFDIDPSQGASRLEFYPFYATGLC